MMTRNNEDDKRWTHRCEECQTEFNAAETDCGCCPVCHGDDVSELPTSGSDFPSDADWEHAEANIDDQAEAIGGIVARLRVILAAPEFEGTKELYATLQSITDDLNSLLSE